MTPAEFTRTARACGYGDAVSIKRYMDKHTGEYTDDDFIALYRLHEARMDALHPWRKGGEKWREIEGARTTKHFYKFGR